MLKRVVLIGAGCVSAALACSGATTSKKSTPLPCDVDAVLAQNCRKCHSDPPQFGAPMPLVSWEDVQAPAVTDRSLKVYQRMGQRIHDDAAPMPQPPNPRLSAADAATLDTWIAASAPADSGQTCAPLPDAGTDAGGACTPDTHLAAASPWSMPQGDTDDYVCYSVTVPSPTRYAVRVSPRIDNTKIVHHVLLFKASSGTTYTSTPSKCKSASGEVGWSVIDGWAPGVSSLDLPPEASLTLDPATRYVVQVHYNNINGLSGQTDTSGFDLCTLPTPRANEADVIAFGAVMFPDIPAHGSLDWTCNYPAGSALAGTHLIATWGHMHKIGTSITTLQVPQQGTPVPLINVPNYSFTGQQWVPTSGTFSMTDTVRTRCVWNNPTSVPVSFGENTEQEMCFGFAMYYPKRSFATFLEPAALASCGVTQ